MRILGLSSDGLLGYEAPRSGAFRKFFGPGGGHFLDAGTFLFRPRGTRPRKCVSRGGDENLLVGEPVCRAAGERVQPIDTWRMLIDAHGSTEYM